MDSEPHEIHAITIMLGRDTYTASYVIDAIAITVTWQTNGKRRQLSTYSAEDHDRTAKQLLREMVLQDSARAG